MQGVVGSMPWNAIAFLTLWLQLLGFSAAAAASLTAAFYASTAAGALLGGALGDAAARAAPNWGRVATAQFSVRCPPAPKHTALLAPERGAACCLPLRNRRHDLMTCQGCSAPAAVSCWIVKPCLTYAASNFRPAASAHLSQAGHP